MKTPLAIAAAALLALTTWTTDAAALDFCPDGGGCKSGDVCHGGLCLPAGLICTSDAGCASYEKCDFSCPHGGGINVTSVDVPPSSGSSEPAEQGGGSDGEDSSSFKAEDDKDDSNDKEQSDPPEGNAKKKPGSGAPAQPPQNTCPKAKGVCVAVPAKTKASAACKSFCAAVTKCSFGSKTGKAVSGSGSSTPGKAPKPTTPAKEPQEDDKGDQDSGGSDFAPSDGDSDDEPSGGSDGSDGDEGAPAPPDEPDDDEEGPNTEPPGDKDNSGKKAPPKDELNVEIDASGCEFACALWENKKIAVTETAAAMQCLDKNKAMTCDDLGKACESEAEALEKALDKDDSWKLAMGGGWGASALTKSSSDDNSGNPESPNAAGTGGDGQAELGAPAHNLGSSGGCTASASPMGNSGGAAFIIFLLAGALMLRRRLTA